MNCRWPNALCMGLARKEWQHRLVKKQQEQLRFLKGFTQTEYGHALVFYAVAHCSWRSLVGICYLKVYLHSRFMVLIYLQCYQVDITWTS